MANTATKTPIIYYGGKTSILNHIMPLIPVHEVSTSTAACKGKFLLSSYNSPMLEDYIQRNGWFKTEITHQIKSPRKTGTAKVEVLVRNYANTCQTLQLQFP